MTSLVHLTDEGLGYGAFEKGKAHRVCRMAFNDRLLPLNGQGGDGRTSGRVLVYRP